MRCEYCQKEFPVDERLVGQDVKCPHCGVPNTCSDRRVLIICPECHKEMEGELWMLGDRGECTYCGKDILLSRPENPGDEYSNSYLPANYVLGNYIVKRCIGTGGMGEVYLVHHKFLDKECALKLLRPDRSGTAGHASLEALVREARLACQIHSPYIIDVMDVEIDEKRNFGYIVMEYVEGNDLETLIAGLPMNEDYVLSIAQGVCHGLIAAASFNVVHRDIKPANIMISRSGDIKLADLGIAKSGGDRTTATGGKITGTVNYAAPEQLLNSDGVDCRADIYSLGATMYHMLSGRRPFDGPSAKVVISKVLKGDFIPLHKVAPKVSKDTCKLIHSMMNMQAEKRPANAEKLLAMVEKIQQKRSETFFSGLWKRYKRVITLSGAAVLLLSVYLGIHFINAALEADRISDQAMAELMQDAGVPEKNAAPAPAKKSEAEPQTAQAQQESAAEKTAEQSAVAEQKAEETAAVPEKKTAPAEEKADEKREQPAAAPAVQTARKKKKAEKSASSQGVVLTARQNTGKRTPPPDTTKPLQAEELLKPFQQPGKPADDVIPAGVEEFAEAVKNTKAGRIAEKVIQIEMVKLAEEAQKEKEAKAAKAKAEAASKAEAPKADVPKEEVTPKADAPKADAPKAEEAPKAEAPKAEAKAAAKTEAPKPAVSASPRGGSSKIAFIRLLLLLVWLFSGLKTMSWLEKKRRKNDPFVKQYQQWLDLAALVAGPVVYLITEFRSKFEAPLKKMKERREALPELLNNQGQPAFKENGNHDSETVYCVRKLLGNALKLHASDIFIDPKSGDVSVIRFRVDGALRVMEEVNSDFGAKIINVLKVAGGMDISERRRPQDGSFSLTGPCGNVSLRAASVGTFSGEKIALRILGDDSGPKSLKEAGLTGETLALMEQAPKLPSGMVLICGPTGSGKTTTLYAMLNSIDYTIKNVVSIEDPIEHVMPSISQMEVNESAGITFSQLLRNSLRQNPDIICLGEIRDEDTAQVAIHAAQTGHLIIATLHSNDNIGTIDRLANLNVPLRSIAGTLRMVVSQRLVRKLCSCKKARKVTAEEALKFRQAGIECSQVYEPKGCAKCGNTGYSGRMALFDVLLVDDELRALLEDEHTNLSNIQKKLQTQTQGNVMERSGLLQAADGVTSLAEVFRVTLELKN